MKQSGQVNVVLCNSHNKVISKTFMAMFINSNFLSNYNMYKLQLLALHHELYVSVGCYKVNGLQD